MALSGASSFLMALQGKTLVDKCDRLNEFFNRVYSGQEEFSDWESLRSQVLHPAFNCIGQELPWIGEAKTPEERNAIVKLFAPSSSLFKLMLFPPNSKHESLLSVTCLPPGTLITLNDKGKQYILPFYQQRMQPQGFKFSIFEYFTVLFANYPVSEARRTQEENARLKKGRSGGAGSSQGSAANFLPHLHAPGHSSSSKAPPVDPVIASTEPYTILLNQYLDALVCINPPTSGVSSPSSPHASPSSADRFRAFTTAGRHAPNPTTSSGRRQFIYVDKHLDAALGQSAYGDLSFNFISVLFDYWLNQMSPKRHEQFRTPTRLQVKCIHHGVYHLFRGIPFMFDKGYLLMKSTQGPQSSAAVELQSFCLSVLKNVVRKSAFHMLRHAFDHSFWATDQYVILKHLIRIWSDLVTPWRIELSVLTSYMDRKRAKLAESAPSTSPTLQHVSAAAPAAPASPAPTAPTEWPQLFLRARTNYSRDFMPLITPLIKVLFYRLAKAPMQNLLFIRMADLACDALTSTTLRELISQNESILTRRPDDPDSRQWMGPQKTIKDSFAFVLEQPAETIVFETLRTNWNDSYRPISDLPELITNATVLAAHLTVALSVGPDHKRVGERVLKVGEVYDLYDLFGLTNSEVENCKLQEQLRAGTSGGSSSSVFPTTEPGTQFLSEEGKQQLLAGQKKCNPMDAKFYGDPRYAPITSLEVAFLVRLFFRFSKWYEAHYGSWINLRPYAHKDFLSLSAVAVVILAIFVAFVRLLFSVL